jgi:hypothetical protein
LSGELYDKSPHGSSSWSLRPGMPEKKEEEKGKAKTEKKR